MCCCLQQQDLLATLGFFFLLVYMSFIAFYIIFPFARSLAKYCWYAIIIVFIKERWAVASVIDERNIFFTEF